MIVQNNHVIPTSFKDCHFAFIDKVQEYLGKYDVIMREPASFDRGAKVAQIQNMLEFELYWARRNAKARYEIELIQWENAKKVSNKELC